MKINCTMPTGNLEGQLAMEGKYKNYTVFGHSFDILTVREWKRVAVVDWNSNDHLTADYVHNIKLSDAVINELLTNKHEYSIWCTIDSWKSPFNQWQPWPHSMYVHNSIERFSSIDPAHTILNANLLSASLDDSPTHTDMKHDSGTIGFGFAAGDIFYGYGDTSKAGFTQHFSGPGRGSVYVR